MLLEGFEENPLPASLEIGLRTQYRSLEGIQILEAAIKGLPGIDEVAYGGDWVDGYARATTLIRVLGYALGVVLSLAALLIVANTIRIGIYARREELEILSLVGASRMYVRAPFVVEGTLQGALGGVLALIFLWLAFLLLIPQLQYALVFLLGNTAPRFLDLGEMLVLVAGGAALGFVGALAALIGWKG